MKVITHRGASAYAPENSLSAFKLAVKMGSTGFEFDVRLTRDKVAVVFHDSNLLRIAGINADIADLDYTDLKKINISPHFSKDFKFQYIPKIEEVVKIISPAAEFVNFEIKNDENIHKGIEEIVTGFIRSKKNFFEKAIVSCFDYPSAKRVRFIDKEIKIGYLRHGLNGLLLPGAIKKAKAIKASSFHINFKMAGKANIFKIHRAGFKVFVYTIDDFKEALKLKERGADGIFSNYPDII